MPESHAGHLGVLGKTLTSGVASAGEVAGDVGALEGKLDTTAGVFGSALAVAGVGKGGWCYLVHGKPWAYEHIYKSSMNSHISLLRLVLTRLPRKT